MDTKRFSFSKGLFSILVALLLTFTLIACDGGNVDQEVLDEAIDTLNVVFASGDSATSVTRNLSLPTTLGEATISWSSSNTSVVANNGSVTRQFANVTVTLTATATLNEATATKDFTVVVVGHDVNAALASIVLAGDNITYNATTDRYTVIGNITLPATANDLTITWESTIPAVLSNTGVVVRPAYLQPDANVTLIASINNEEREFDVLIPAIADKPVSLILQEASDTLLIPGVSDGVSQNINLPAAAGTEGVTVTWESSHPAIVSNAGVVVRPDENTTVILTATLTLSEQSITKEFEVVVLADVDFIDVDNVAEAILISRSGENDLGVTGVYVRIKDVTIIGVTGDGVVFADDSGILFAYTAMFRSDLVIGDVYDVRGTTARFFGSWQLAGNATSPLVFTESDGDVTVLTPVVVDSVTDMLANHEVPEPTAPDINYGYYQLTAKIRIQSATDNYGTVFVDPDYAGGDVPTGAATAHTEDGVIVYYRSNKAAFDAFDGLVVTFNVLLYGYRSDRNIFSTLFLETINDIETTLDDQGIVDVAEQTILNSLLPEYSENTTLDLPTTLLGTTITWTSSNTAIIDPVTGELTLPAEGQETVTLTAVIVSNAVEKEVTIDINVGEMVTISIADARAAALGVKVQIEGIVTGISYSSNFNNAAVFLQDATGGMFLFRMSGGADVAVGDLLSVVGTRAVFNGLEQLGAGSTYEILSSGNAFIAEELVETDEFIDSQSQYVYVTGTLKEKASISTTGADNSTVILVGEKEVTITINHPGDYADIAVRNALIALLEDLEVGDTISVFGPLGWSNGPRIVAYTAMDIVVGGYVELNDLEKATQVAGLLAIPTEIEDAMTLDLPATGAYGSTITYESSDTALINAETGVVTLPATGNVMVTLTATVTVGTTEFERVVIITVGEIIRTVAYVRDATPGTVVTIEATITVVEFDEREAYTDQAVVFVEDATAGIYLYKVPAEFKGDLVVGNTIKIRANRTVFNDLVQLNGFVSIEVTASDVVVAPTVVTDPAELFNTQGQLVSVTGYLRQAYAGTPADFHLVTTAGTFALRVASGNDIPAAKRTLIIEKLVGVPAGTEVTVVAGAGRFRANAQVMLFNEDQITIGALGSEAELGAVAAAHFVAPEGDNEVIADITLPTSGLFGSVVEWVSDAPTVIANDGTVVRPLPGSEDAIVNLTYELKIGETVYATGVVEYTVLAEEEVVVEGETLLYHFDYATGHGFSYQNPEAAVDFTNLVDDSLFSTTLYRTSANTANIAEQTTSRALVISPRLGGDNTGEAYVVLNFGTDVINRLEFDTYFWNSSAEPLITTYVLQVWDTDTEAWVLVQDLFANITTTLVVNNIVVENLEGSVFRFYATGGQDGGNNARVLLDNLKAFEVLPPVEETTYIETFEFITTSTTNYATSLQNTDANGFEWDLLGRANVGSLTLGNLADVNFIQVTATGGISSFTVDLVRAFTNTNLRSVELIVNDVSQGTFDVDVNSNDVQVFTVENINIAGPVVIKLISTSPGTRGAIIADNFSWTTYTPAE